MTLPEEIAALAKQLYEVCERYKVETVVLTQHIGQHDDSMNQFTVEIEHKLGLIDIVKDPPYFCMPENGEEIAPALSAGIACLVDHKKRALLNARSDLSEAENDLITCEDNLRTVSLLDPGVLDQIVMAMEESD
jgi:hypothetical protein